MYLFRLPILELLHLLVYYEVPLGNREEVKQKFAKFFSINVSSISR